jgi:hypothetical protein
MYYDVRNPNMAAGLGPGTGVLRTAPSRYYWMIYSGAEGKPDEVRGFTSAMDVNFPRQPFGPMANAIKRDLTTSPKLSKLIVWDSLLPKKLDLTDKVLDMLGPDWKRESDEVFYARDHWTWKDMFTVRRRVYVKITPTLEAPTTSATTAPIAATTAPTTAPATQPVDP